MKAISCAAPNRLELIDIDPPVLRPGWVRVAIRHIGICGTDYHIFEGSFPYFEYPRVIGHELSGIVVDANGASGLKDESRCEDVDVRSVGKRLVSVEIRAEDRRGCGPASRRVVTEMAEVFE